MDKLWTQENNWLVQNGLKCYKILLQNADFKRFMYL